MIAYSISTIQLPIYSCIYVLRTDLKPLARFKAVWPVIKPSGWIVSGPGPFYSRPGSNPDHFETIQPRRGTSGNPRSYRPTKACPRLRKAAYRSRSAPGRVPRPPSRACKYNTSAIFLPARRCYTRSSLFPSFQLFRAPSGHSKCLPHRPARYSIACPAPVSVFVSASLCAALLCQWSGLA